MTGPISLYALKVNGVVFTIVAVGFGNWDGGRACLGKEVLRDGYGLECSGLLDRVGARMMLVFGSIFG